MRDQGQGGGGSGVAGQVTVEGLGARVGRLLGRFGAAAQGPVAAGADPRMGPLLRMLGRELGRRPRGSHAVMLGDLVAEQQRELGMGDVGRVARAWVSRLEGGKLAPPPGERVAVRRVLTRAQHELIHGGDRRAGVLQPGEALAERDWADLRDGEPGLTVPFLIDDPPSMASGAFTAQRFTVTTGDGRQVTVTEVTVTVRLVPGPRVTGENVEQAKSRLLDNVDAYANYQHVLPDGSQFHYRIVFSDDPDTARQSPTLYQGNGRARGHKASSRRLYVDMKGSSWAHEGLHWLGLPDRYQDPRTVNRRQEVSPGVRYDAALMSTQGVWWADESPLELRPETGQDPRGVGLFAGLKDVDLDRLYGLIQQAARGSELPVAAGEARPREPEEVTFRAAGLPQLADVVVPGRVTRMLGLFPPQEGTLELALLLDWGRELLGQEQADIEEARYAVGLVLLAGDVYGGIAFHTRHRLVDEPLMGLVRFFGWVIGTAEPYRYLPGPGDLRGLVAGLLGLPPSFEVTAAEADAAARAVDQYVQKMEALPILVDQLEVFAWEELPRLLQADSELVRAYGRLLQFADELTEVMRNPDGSQRIEVPALPVAAQVAALAREAAGPGRWDVAVVPA